MASDGGLARAERLLLRERDIADVPDEMLYRQARLRTKLGVFDSVTSSLLDHLVSVQGRVADRAILLKLEFDWEFGSEAVTLLEELCRFEASRGPLTGGEADELRIALLLEAGLIDRLELGAKENPHWIAFYDRVLPWATFLAERRLTADRVAAHAELDQGLCDKMDKRMMVRFSPERRIAVIGNSACEIGRARGAEIDQYNDIVRFNQFSVAEKFALDYGRRTTVIARVPVSLVPNEPEVTSNHSVVFSGRNFRYRWRNWDLAMRYHKVGARLFAIPTEVHQDLIPKLRASPSSGLAMAALLKRVRGRLDRRDFFGFSFVDQIGENAAPSHYFENSRATHRHRWEQEIVEFERLF
jgi:hypothetical protein